MTSTAAAGKISLPVQVMYFDTDAGGVVHNIAYLRFIETARTLLAIQLGMSFSEIERTGIHPVVVRTEIDYKRPGRLGEDLLVNGHLAEVGRVRFWVAFEVLRASDHTVLVTCRQSLALLQMPSARPVKVSEGFPGLLPSCE